MRIRPTLRRCLALVAAAFLTAPALAQDFDDFGFPPDGEKEVTVTAEASAQSVAPGQLTVIAVTLQFADGWHAWPSVAQDVLPKEIAEFAYRTEIGLIDASDLPLRVGAMQWPKLYEAKVAGYEQLIPTYGGTAIAYIPIQINADAPEGPLTVPVRAYFQACNDITCIQPEDVRTSVELTIDAGAPAQTHTDGAFEGFDDTALGDFVIAEQPDLLGQDAASEGGAGRSFFGITIPPADSAAGLIVLALLGVLGGAILNLTPCVLPVIPIKIMTITSHAGSAARSLYLGLWMAGGVVGFWLALGVLAAVATGWADPSRLFGIWWVTLVIGLLIVAMGVGIMGFFSITLPQKVYAVNPKADSPGGSFMFGVMTGVLGLPCFGFVAGALLAGAATMPKVAILAVFAGIGLGMASPYLILSAKPSLVSRVPRTGPASDLVKQVMGLLLLAAGVYFVGSAFDAYAAGSIDLKKSLPWWTSQVKFWAIGVLAVMAGGWLLVRTFQLSKHLVNRAVFGLIGLFIASVATAYAVDSTIKASNDFWIPYEPDVLAAARESGEVVVVEFTAEWCLTCRWLEATILTQEPVRGLLTSPEVIALKADNTADSAPGWDLMKELGQTGIPLLVIWGPGLEDGPWVKNGYTSGQVVDAIKRASGKAE